MVPVGPAHQKGLFSPDPHHGFAAPAGESLVASPNRGTPLCDMRRTILICHPLHCETKLMLGRDLVVLWQECSHKSKTLLLL